MATGQSDHLEKLMSLVQLYVYDLSKGMAKMFAPFLKIDIEGIWHSAVVVHGREIYFGNGVQIVDAGKTNLGPPQAIEEIGYTEIPWEIVEEFVTENMREDWSPGSYHLLEHNCNHFSEELSRFLTGNIIPSYISTIASKVAATPLGQLLAANLVPGNSVF